MTGSCSATPANGFAAAFASPMSAVNAAIDAQRELQLPVRMGLATGDAELRDGDYFGTVLNRAARVMAAGAHDVVAPRPDCLPVPQHRPKSWMVTMPSDLVPRTFQQGLPCK
jgi:hypothetical protein